MSWNKKMEASTEVVYKHTGRGIIIEAHRDGNNWVVKAKKNGEIISENTVGLRPLAMSSIEQITSEEPPKERERLSEWMDSRV